MKKYPLFFLTIIMLSFLLASISHVNATSYEWIQDGGFEQTGQLEYENVILNPSFEYGNLTGWSTSGSVSVISASPQLGVYHASLGTVTSTEIYQEFSPVLTVDNISSIYVYVKRSGGTTLTAHLRVDYNDTSFDSIITSALGETYSIINGTGQFDSGKFIERIEVAWVTSTASELLYVDNFVLLYSNPISSFILNENTYPWYTNYYSIHDDGTNYIGLTDDENNSGVYSAYLINYPLRMLDISLQQDINYLSSSNISSVSLYAKTDSVTNTVIQFWLMNLDGTATVLRSLGTNLNVSSGWTLLNFSLSSLPSGKIVRSIRILIEGTSGNSGSSVWIDDVSLIATVPVTTSRFTYYVSPEPISYSRRGFSAYFGTTYVFYGQWFDVNGNATNDGSFIVVSNLAQVSGLVVDGEFHFTINKRERVGSEISRSEHLTITLTLNDVQVIDILITWIYNTDVVPPIPNTQDDTTTERTNNLIDWIVMFMVIFLPALLLAGACMENNKDSDGFKINPVFGIVSGLILSVGLGFYTGLVPLWILILMIIVVGLLIAGLLYRSGGNDNQ